MGNYFINIRYQILVVLLSLITLSTYAQKSKWANNAGSGTTSDQGNSIAVDQCGNSYVTGYFKNTGKFGNFSVKSSGESDIFISKYNTFGNIRWVRSMGGGKDDIGNGVAADINGNVFVTGYIQDTVRIGAITLISKGKKDFFIAKYDSIGNLLWAKSGGSANNDEEGIAVQSDLSGNCYITGYFQGKLNYGTDSIISKGDKDIFVMKLDVNGNMIWLKQIGGSLEDNVSGLAIDNTGNIYLTGYFRSTILYFGSTPLSNFGTNFNDVFIACYKPNGNLSWTKDAGGPSDEISNAIAVDLYDNVYITGIFYDADANFDGIKPKYYGQSDIFIAKYDQNQKLLWVKSAGGIKTDISTGIAVDFQKNIFITGYFEETSNFGSSTLTSAGNHDIFIAKYDSLGKNLWTTSAGNLKDDYSMSIGVDPMGNCYLTGSFNDKIKFDSINLLTVDGNPGQDIFITKYGLDIPCTLKADAGADQTINFGSNAIISASATGGNTYFYSWGNGIGYTKNRVVSPTITTVYKLTVTSLPSGCSSIDSVTINISTSACQVDVGSDKTICRGDTVSLSVSGGDTYKWNNGLGTNSSIIDIPQITTIYRVTLTKGGCTSSDMVIINVIDATTADFNYDVVDLGNATHFTDMSVQGGGSLNHWYWQFGDSGTSSIENPSHIYSSAGTKNVCLSVEDTRGCKASICKNVTVNQPGACKANAGNDKTICRGDTITLSASGGDYYSWSSGANTPNTTIVPNTTTTYIVSVISNGTCFASDNVVITVNPIPVANAGSDVTINSGASTTLPASGGGTYSWSNNKTTASISVNPTITTTYFVTVSNNGCSNSAKVVVNVNATCSAYAGQDVTICKGNSATLNASGGNSYKWSNNQTTTSISVNPTITTTYIVTATTGTCTASDNVVVTVNPIQVANAGSDVTINSGASTTLTASGGGTYSWSNNKTTASISVNPTITTTYFVTVKNNGCSNSAKVVVNVNATCSAYAGQDVTICKGNSATLNASGGNSYKWNNNQTTTSISVNPTSTTTYIVTATTGTCTASDNVVVTVNPIPVANAGSDITINSGTSTTLTASGGGTYSWSNNKTTASISVNPTITTTYFVTVKNNGCSNSAKVIVNVKGTCAANAGNDKTICDGDMVTLSASGGDQYSWSSGANIATTTLVPFTTTTYTVTVISNGTCTATDNVVITVNPIPLANAGTDETICKGNSATLNASGGNSYKWSNNQTTTSIIVNPTSTTTYVVTATTGTCTASDNVVVTVNLIPVANAGSDVTINSGASTTLTASGGGTYSWSNNKTTASINVNPTIMTTYYVTVSNNGCSNSAKVVVTVNATCSANAGPDVTICAGNSATLTASGGNSYKWNNNQTTSSIIVSPASSSTYNVTATTGICTASDNVVVTVNPIPVANAGSDVTINSGASTTLTASGGGTYSWSNNKTTTSISVNPTITTTYFITVSNNGCSNSAKVVVNVNATCSANAGPDVTICKGNSATLTASGGNSYKWNNNQTTSSIIVSPASSSTYKVTATTGTCTASDNVVVTVNPIPVANAGSDVTINSGTSTTLTASGNGTYSWSNNKTTASINVNPTITTTYFVAVSNNGCSNSAKVVVTVNPSVLCSVSAGNNQTICTGTNINLTGSGANTYIWNNNSTSNTISVKPGITTTYSVTGTTISGCTASAQVVVTVNTYPGVNLRPTMTLCNGNSSTIVAPKGFSYKWSTGETTYYIDIKPTITSTYKLTTTNAGCSETDSVVAFVNPVPVADAGNDKTIKYDEVTTLSATGGDYYVWSDQQEGEKISVNPEITTTYTVTVKKSGCTASDKVIVKVGPALCTANAGSDKTICLGDSIAIKSTVRVSTNDTTGLTYLWNNGITTSGFTVLPTVNTTYTLTISIMGCTSSDNIVISPNSLPLAYAGKNISVCLGDSAIIKANVGAYFYKWSNNDITSTLRLKPSHTTTYKLTVYDKYGCYSTDDMVLTVNPLPIADAGENKSICPGQATILNAKNKSSQYLYSWSNGKSDTAIAVSPSIQTTYFLTVANQYGCTATDQSIVYINPEAIANAGSDQTICNGSTGIIKASPSYTYLWNTGDKTQQIVVNPTNNIKYTLTVTNISGCSATDEINITISNIIANTSPDKNICKGDTTVIYSSGGKYYNWSNGQKSSIIKISPSESTFYKVTVSNEFGCESTSGLNITVYSMPYKPAGYNKTVCNGESTTLIAVDKYKYLWSEGSTTRSITIYPSLTTTYSLTITNEIGCTATDNVIITVSNNPVADAGPDLTVCYGAMKSLTGKGGIFYKWSTGQSTATITVSPTISSKYQLTVSNNYGCSASDELMITIKGNPVSINKDTAICKGNSITLSASGTNTYKWDSGEETSYITVQPIVTTTYYVTGFAEGCNFHNSVIVTLKNNVYPEVVGNRFICSGDSLTLNAKGGKFYLWNTGDSTASLKVTPSISSSYTVTISNEYGCKGTGSIFVTVNPLPSGSAGHDRTICNGSKATLIAAGGTAYKWSTGSKNSSIIVNPNTNSKYIVTITNLYGCSIKDTIKIFVNPAPVVNAGKDKTICFGNSATLTGTGDKKIFWNTGDTSANITVHPLIKTTYILTTTNYLGCASVDSVTVFVNPVPAISAGNDLSLCSGSSANLTASGGNSYTWTTGANTSTISVKPVGTTTFTVSGTDKNGCSSTASVIVYVNTLPMINAGNDLSICRGNSVSLYAFANGTYSWNNGSNKQTISVIPTITSTYIVTVTDNNKCTATDDVIVYVNNLPVANAGPDLTVCYGSETKLTATGGDTYMWNTFESSPTISVKPLSDTKYHVTVSNIAGCTATDEVAITIDKPSKPSLSINGQTDVCDSNKISTKLNASSGYKSYSWSNNLSTSGITVTKLGNYFVAVKDNFGCIANSDTINFVMIPHLSKPVLFADGPSTFCENKGTLHLSIKNDTCKNNGCYYTYHWSSGSSTPVIKIISSSDYSVTVTDFCNNKYISDTIKVNAIRNSSADFSYFPIDYLKYNFYGNNSYGDNFIWDFGDGTTSSSINTVHTFPDSGSYTVKLTAKNSCSVNTSQKVITVFKPSGISQNDINNSYFDIYPNPFSQSSNIKYYLTQQARIRIEIYDITGKLISVLKDKTESQGEYTLPFSLPEGMYFIRLNIDGNSLMKKVLGIN